MVFNAGEALFSIAWFCILAHQYPTIWYHAHKKHSSWIQFSVLWTKFVLPNILNATQSVLQNMQLSVIDVHSPGHTDDTTAMRSICNQKIDNRKEVSKVSERFYWSRQKVSDRSQNQVGRELSFEHLQKTGRDRFAIGIINFERLPPNFIADTMNWFLNSMLD